MRMRRRWRGGGRELRLGQSEQAMTGTETGISVPFSIRVVRVRHRANDSAASELKNMARRNSRFATQVANNRERGEIEVSIFV